MRKQEKIRENRRKTRQKKYYCKKIEFLFFNISFIKSFNNRIDC
jgi:hypothetical protein